MSIEALETADRAVAVIGVGAILPDALNAKAFWANIIQARYSITDVSPERWNPADYYSADPKAADKTYSKVGGWVRDFTFDSMRYRIPPKVAAAMDESQMWGIAATREALTDAGHPDRLLDLERVATVLGNAMGGEKHYATAHGVVLPATLKNAFAHSPSFSLLDASTKTSLLREINEYVTNSFPGITEDSMPGELANVVAGRIAHVFDFHGPNFIVDAACASSLAAVDSAIEGLLSHHFDVAVTGGIDRNMSPATFIKFSRIGALSPDGSRPFAKGANGFVMGEGAAVLLLKRLADAERDGDKVYAVIRGIGGSSDGKGKAITAPNPEGQKRAVVRAYERAGFAPSTVSLIEAHGTATPVGDLAEFSALEETIGKTGLPRRSVVLGSVKSQIGHLKASAGAAGLLKAVLALHHKVLPPSAQFDQPNPEIRFESSALYVNTEARPWERPACGIRRAGVSSFGFGGTNFHVVLEEHIPGMLTSRRPQVQVPATIGGSSIESSGSSAAPPMVRGMAMASGNDLSEVRAKLVKLAEEAAQGRAPARELPEKSDLTAKERIAIDFGNAAELKTRADKAITAVDEDRPAGWRLLRGQGVFRGVNAPGKVAFLFPGQGSQYVNMLRELRDASSTVRAVFDEADEVMRDNLEGRVLTQMIFVDDQDPKRLEDAEAALRHTKVTQPAMLAVDVALARLLGDFDIKPDLVMGHSLGEYAALVVAGVMPFADALLAVSARAKEMSSVSLADSGKMAGVIGPAEKIEGILATVNGYVVCANRNTRKQTVIAGASAAVDEASEKLRDAGMRVIPLPVSHAFHSEIVAPASEPLRRVISRLSVSAPLIPVVGNVDGELYPSSRDAIIDRLARQIAAPVQFIKGLDTLYANGARVFVEVGPKKILASFAEDCLEEHGDIVALATNNPKKGPEASFGAALAYLYSIGRGRSRSAPVRSLPMSVSAPVYSAPVAAPEPVRAAAQPSQSASQPVFTANDDTYLQMGKLFASFLDQGASLYRGGASAAAPNHGQAVANNTAPAAPGSVVVSGVSVGLPGTSHRLFDDNNFDRLLQGEQMIGQIPQSQADKMVDKNIVRLVKNENASPSMERIDHASQVLKLAGRRGPFNLNEDFGIHQDRSSAYDITTEMAVGAGIEALRDAGIPLVRRYKKTTTGSHLPDRWALPESLADETGIIFTSAFPGYTRFADILGSYYEHKEAQTKLDTLIKVREVFPAGADTRSIDALIEAERTKVKAVDHHFDRKFLFEVLSFGHAQFAELIGARGPNTAVNSACASTTLAVAIAEDWIRTGRCARVIVIAADDITSDTLLPWFGAGFLATGAASTESDVTKAALPFDRRRHGMIIGMGAAALVVESEDMLRARGMRGIAEILVSNFANSAFHGTRLDVDHISAVMNRVITEAETRHGIDRRSIAAKTVFVSHETYTPARGGSAAAEINALRYTFGAAASDIVIANVKGFTGHPMAVGLEDALAVKVLEKQMVPPIPNFKEVDPELGQLNLSRGGSYPIEYALRFAAGFGSQLAVTLYRRISGTNGRVADQSRYAQWLREISGYPQASTEIAFRTLRIRDEGVPAQATPPSVWNFGDLPKARCFGPVAAVQASPAPKAIAPVVSAQPEFKRPASSPPPSAPRTMSDPVGEIVMKIVADKTGYPTDMLALDLDLEADLGIDTVKQAEVFAEIRKSFNLPRRDDLKLREYPTLAHVIGYVRSGRPDLPPPVAAAAVSPAPAAQAASAGPAIDALSMRVMQIVADKTGYPTDMLALDLDMEADLGIDTVKQAEVFAEIRKTFELPRRDDLKLREYPTLGHVIGYVRAGRPDLAAASPVQTAAVHAAPVSQSTAPVSGQMPSGLDEVDLAVLKIVADKTGYPTDMLALDLDLEADLGVDTVKQAEVFAEIRKTFDLPRRDDMKLRDYPTLAHVIGFVRSGRPELARKAPVAAPVSVSAPVHTAAPSGHDDVTRIVLEIVADKTGYPTDMLALDLDLEADLGVDTVKQAEVMAQVRDRFQIPRINDIKLRDYPTLAHVVEFVRSHSTMAQSAPSASASGEPAAAAVSGPKMLRRLRPLPILRPALEVCKASACKIGAGSRVLIVADHGGVGQKLATLLRDRKADVLFVEAGIDGDKIVEAAQAWAGTHAIDGLFFLRSLDADLSLDEMEAATFQNLLNGSIRSLYTVTRALRESLGRHGAFLLSATRLGGNFGYGPRPATSPTGGAVSGYTKAFAKEYPESFVKVVDFDASKSVDKISHVLLDEVERDPGALEIGYAEGHRYGITVVEEQGPTEAELETVKLGPDSVFVVTGAGGAITSAITADLARASKGTFYLLDLAPAPNESNPDLKRIANDREGLKRDITSRLKGTADRVTPVMVEKELWKVERDAATLEAIQSIERAGGKVVYHSCNVTDVAAIEAILAPVGQKHGRIDVILHAAGVEKSRPLEVKEPNEFNLIVDVKAVGIFGLLNATRKIPVGTVVSFSSVAGRFGNLGQVDYSAANDFLCKVTSHLPTLRPGTKAVALDWSAWGGIGMATRGSIPEIMKRAGIDMLIPEEAIPVVREEILRSKGGELVIAGALGILTTVRDSDGGIEPSVTEKLAAVSPLAMRVVRADPFEGVVFEVMLSPKEPFLDDHRIDGIPVLPGVMGVELFARAASAIASHKHVVGAKDIRFEAPFKCYRDEPRKATITVRVVETAGGMQAICELTSVTIIKGSNKPAETKRHFAATLVLEDALPKAVEEAALALDDKNGSVSRDDLYKAYFHGNAFRVMALGTVASDAKTQLGILQQPMPNLFSSEEIHALTAPRLLELCFQTAGLIEIGLTKRLGLPSSIESLQIFESADDKGPSHAQVRFSEKEGSMCFEAVVISEDGHKLMQVSGYRTSAIPSAFPDEIWTPLHEGIRGLNP